MCQHRENETRLLTIIDPCDCSDRRDATQLFIRRIPSRLVEIKTPKTRLLGSEYRHGVFPPSQELAGAVAQVANYRDSLAKENYTLAGKSLEGFQTFDSPCLVVAGNSSELTDAAKKLFQKWHGVQ
jgi:hypothetical protein